ncbi:DUF221-domain-containing protein [Didymella exigua CBS 183.55]|uniref:DUF221-domain-containing protein n=1 Tax=Didymella exigua CBS 183.55 TaxID=1150837 RepID=A0A6A5R7E7_9PLEO|nr:DUF221-domain-containing protein [Didymella exigua CBS 183.55]KAF1924101.1 DUF221-domain-containing protein [Didymella exigua CBS 183.55]
MSATSASESPTSTQGTGAALGRENQSIAKFAASLSTAAVVFGVQMGVFLILSGNWKLMRSKKSATEPQTQRQTLFQRIYYYKTAFVPEAKRIAAPVTAIESIKTVFKISDRELIRIAGVDGFLFLQYLQLLLRIFVPMACVILPILLPINRIGDEPNVSGLDSFAWPNVAFPDKRNRLWAHLILAVLVVCWVCFNFFLALRKFVRLRQTILTMPEHRIRASATTILVQSIPRKWLTAAALDALYDVFPGGIKEIWINRNYDELQDKVNKRSKIARTLESAETNLIIKCTKKHKEMVEAKAKEEGKKKTKKERKAEETEKDIEIANETLDHGTDAGNPHQIERQLQSVLEESESSSSSSSSRSSSPSRKKGMLPIPFVGQGLHAVGDGFRDVGQGVGNFNKKLYGGLKGAFAGKDKHGQPQSHLDGSGDRPISSPTSADFALRGASSDTYSPLAVPDQDPLESERTVTQTSTPDEKHKHKHHHKETKEKKSAFQKFSDSRLNPVRPLRRMSDDFTSPQPFRKEGEVLPEELKEPIKVKYDLKGVYNEDLVEDGETALWRSYVTPKDRDTMRLPIFSWDWWPSIPLIGKKVDTIYHCRKELARLNAEIDEDQAHPERYPLMNSAFIQFNHQVAAHMACQSLSHHVPRQMDPRTVEVNPNHVLWENLTMKWWERYLRLFGVIVLIIGLIIFWGIPVSFTGALSQVSTLTDNLPWLSFLEKLPPWALSFVEGVLPPILLAVLFAVLPILLRFLAGATGTTTSGERELLVQNFYFAFVFIQLFLVVSLSTGITATIEEITNNPIGIPQTLAQNLPRAANYFFSYMILQALSISSGTLLQIGAIAVILLFGFFDTTPREKVSRILNRSGMNWGTMIPVYTNFGAIGIIYSVISPLIMVMMLITFSLFWFTYRYQMIYVSYAKAETNGLIFPKAVNQLFTGIYFMELCLIGLFFLQNDSSCLPHAIIMIITLIFTVLFQFVLNRAFSPLFTYLPITFEDEAVERDQEFQRIQAARWTKDDDAEHQSLVGEEAAAKNAEQRERAHMEAMDRLDAQRTPSGNGNEAFELRTFDSPERSRKKWANKSCVSVNDSRSHSHSRTTPKKHKRKDPIDAFADTLKRGLDDVTDGISRPVRDIESQVLPAANLFDNIDDELQDIEPEARQKLIKRSFQHPATRTIQPAVWIPHDELGISKDEIQRTSAFSNWIWITSVNARLDGRGKVMYRGLPPDRDPFENMEV